MRSGRQAEEIAAAYLEARGYSVLSRNWRTRLCEIDLVARKDNVIYMVEVKYRSTSRQGEGYHYVTPVKLRRMAFAAELWVQFHHWRGPYQLAVVSVYGQEFMVTDLIVLAG
jgi:Holliday junction resolvase-like predicted endonuclease